MKNYILRPRIEKCNMYDGRSVIDIVMFLRLLNILKEEEKIFKFKTFQLHSYFRHKENWTIALIIYIKAKLANR